MYIINNFCYGVDINKLLAAHPSLSDFMLTEVLCINPIETQLIGFHEDIITFEIEHWYHGSARGNYFSGVVGFNITCDDRNPNYVYIVRNASEQKYKELWDICMVKVKKQFDDILTEVKNLEGEEKWTDEEFQELELFINYIINTKPTFYSVESSS